MQEIKIAKLTPSSPRLTGAVVGEAHAQQVRNLALKPAGDGLIILDFAAVESASASYLKRLLNPFFLQPEDVGAFEWEICPILTSLEHPDLIEDIEDYLCGKGQVLLWADVTKGKPKLKKLLGKLDGAAGETFEELRRLKVATAAQLYDLHRHETTNQTAWNNRLAQLVAMRIARRSRQGRVWLYEPTII